MKKFFFIFIPIVLIALFAWFYLRNGNTPIAQTLNGGLPFGTAEGVNIPSNTDNTVGETTNFDQGVSSDSKIFRIANTPVAGFTILTRGNNAVVRYLDRATGHIFDIPLPKEGENTVLEKMRVTNNTLPKIYEAYFSPNGNNVLIRSLEGDGDLVKNMSLTLTPPKASSSDEFYSVTATSLRGGIGSIVVGSNGNLFYSLADGGSIVSSSFTNPALKTLFSSAFTNWRLGKLGNNLLVTSKASSVASGYAYSLNASGGALTRLLGPLNGLVAVANPSGNLLLYSYYENGQTKLFTKNLSKNTTAEILPATLAEKCVWSAKSTSVFYCGTPLNGLSGAEPDNWYLGGTHFTDYIWQFDTNSEIAKLIAEPKTDFSLDLDVSEPKLTPNEDFLIFINQRDLTLWAVRI